MKNRQNTSISNNMATSDVASKISAVVSRRVADNNVYGGVPPAPSRGNKECLANALPTSHEMHTLIPQHHSESVERAFINELHSDGDGRSIMTKHTPPRSDDLSQSVVSSSNYGPDSLVCDTNKDNSHTESSASQHVEHSLAEWI
jgi:hypothetical protein